ncbi:hypothetical protein FSP39_020983 [Pinctada imbricata]|uniref:Uncharacterized protein n=1 Tax=Pinctada imbricata TaxID=66713 RepID=A0AA88YP89_PINIB|nr:hypothetical protein FSP39_020983 [Pinctada imbricata]
MASEEESVSLSQILQVVKKQGETFERYQQEYANTLDELKREVVSNSQLKKFKSDAAVKWRFEGNRLQYSFNEELLDLVNQIDWALKYGKAEYATELLSDVSSKIERRNKLIRIADTSDGGWETVRQYENNPLADDSEDESRINRA